LAKESEVERIEAIIRPERLNLVNDALAEAELVGLIVTPVTGRGIQRGIQVGGPRNPAEKPCCDEMRWRITRGLGQVWGIG
jgi:nitrogen regulatory protein PII